MRFFPSTPAVSGYVSGRMTHADGATGFLLNRGRLTAQVGPKPFFGIKIQGDFSGAQAGKLRSDSTVAGFSLTDAYVELVPPPKWATPGSVLAQLHPAIVTGQFKTPYSLEYLSSFATLKTADRSQAVDRLSLKRDIGAMAQVGWGRIATLSGAVVNGEGPNATSNPDKTQMLMTRLTITPIPILELSAKIANEGADHSWGYDGRALWRGLTVEGEGLYRKRPTSSTILSRCWGRLRTRRVQDPSVARAGVQVRPLLGYAHDDQRLDGHDRLHALDVECLRRESPHVAGVASPSARLGAPERRARSRSNERVCRAAPRQLLRRRAGFRRALEATRAARASRF